MTEDQIINICTKFSDEVNNGGFLQFFYNDDKAYTNHIIHCLKAIGATEMSDICQRALCNFSSLPDDLEERRAFLTQVITPEILEQLQDYDTQFNFLSDDLEEKLGNYIDLHASEPANDPAPKTASKDYYALYIKHRSKTITNPNDFADPKLRRKHNKAMTEIHRLNMEMFAMPDKGINTIARLLQHEDPHVRISAGAYCISAQLLVNEGRRVLQKIATDPSMDSMCRFDAQNCLSYCRPYKT